MNFIKIGTDIINVNNINSFQIITDEKNDFHLTATFVNGEIMYLEYLELAEDEFKALNKLMELLCQN